MAQQTDVASEESDGPSNTRAGTDCVRKGPDTRKSNHETDELAEIDHICWCGSVYKIAATGSEISDIDGNHVNLVGTADEYTIAEHLFLDWLHDPERAFERIEVETYEEA